MNMWKERWRVEVNGVYEWHACAYRDDATKYLVSLCCQNGDTAIIADLEGKYPAKYFEFRDGTLYHVA